MSKLDDTLANLVTDMGDLSLKSTSVESLVEGFNLVLKRKREIKDVMIDLINEAYEGRNNNGGTIMDVLRKKIEEL